jgi:hypothetical protein
MALVDEVLNVQHPADRDRRVAPHAVIQYDQAFANPSRLPNAARA